MTAPSRKSTAGARPTRVIASRAGIGSENLDGGDGGPHDPGMEARVARLEGDMSEVKGLLYNQVLPLLHRIDERLNHTATKADVANIVADLKAENAQTRSDLSLSINQLRSDVSTEFGQFRGEVSNEFGKFRSEVAKEFSEVRAETSTEFANVRTEIAEISNRILTDANQSRAEVATKFVAVRSEIVEVRMEMSTRLMGIQAELAERPTRSYLWMVVGVMVATVLAAAIGGATLVGMLK
jgi:hypothetical protein